MIDSHNPDCHAQLNFDAKAWQPKPLLYANYAPLATLRPALFPGIQLKYETNEMRLLLVFPILEFCKNGCPAH